MTACHCKTCGIITKHRPHRPSAKQPHWFVCEVCGTERWYAKAFGAGDFPELTHDENEVIHEARALGYGPCFPCYPTAEAQARNTLAGARAFLDRLNHGCKDCGEERQPRIVAGHATCPECGSTNIVRA